MITQRVSYKACNWYGKLDHYYIGYFLTLMSFNRFSDTKGISEHVKLLQNPKQGRYAVAREEIPIGAVIVEEAPNHYLLNPDNPDLVLEFCRHCFQSIASNSLSIPCTGCSSVMFCSTSCRSASLESVHKYECELDLYHLRSKSTPSSFRIFLSLLAVTRHSIEELETMGEAEIMQMEAHHQDQKFEQELKYLSITMLLLALLRKTSYYNVDSKSGTNALQLLEEELKVAETVHHLLRVQNFNTHPLLTAIEQNGRNDKDFNVGLSRLGDCINIAIGSNFNHSCNPNTFRINTDCPPKTLLIASRNIKKGRYQAIGMLFAKKIVLSKYR